MVELRLPYDERLCTAGGVMHGGALMSLAARGAEALVVRKPQLDHVAVRAHGLDAERAGERH